MKRQEFLDELVRQINEGVLEYFVEHDGESPFRPRGAFSVDVQIEEKNFQVDYDGYFDQPYFMAPTNKKVEEYFNLDQYLNKHCYSKKDIEDARIEKWKEDAENSTDYWEEFHNEVPVGYQLGV